MAKAMAKSAKSSPAAAKKTSGSRGRSTQENSDGSNESSLMEEFLLDAVKDIYWAEKHLLKALPKMEKAATSSELKKSLADHLEVTREQVSRLDQVFEILGKKPQAKKCEAMEGLTKEAESIIEDTEKGSMTRDAALIIAAQKVEHYEIASYGGLKQIAATLGKTDLSNLFDQTLAEEKEADQLLTDIAENSINIEASEEE